MYISTFEEKMEFITKCEKELRNIFMAFLKHKHRCEAMPNHYEIDLFYKELSFNFYNQIWSNTGNGWDSKRSIVCHAFSYSKNFVAISKRYEVAFVFIDKYAYTCKTNEKFYIQFNGQNLPGGSPNRYKFLNLIHFKI